MARRGYYDEDGNWHEPGENTPPPPPDPPPDPGPVERPGGDPHGPGPWGGHDPSDPNDPTPDPGPYDPNPNPTPTPTPTPTPRPDWTPPVYGGPWAPDMSYWQDAPNFSFDFHPFDAPAAFSYENYTAPTQEQAQAEPGYDFARSEGIRALTNSAAARGLGRTGGTLKDLLSWGNRFADQNYTNVDQRARGTYTLNRNNALGNYDMNFQNLFNVYRNQEDQRFGIAKEEYAPRYNSWTKKMTDFGIASQDAFRRAWDNFVHASDDSYRRWHDTVYNPNAG